MSELTLLVLRLAFLVLLWVFVFVIVYALRSDLFGQRVRRMPQTAARPRPRPRPRPSPAAAATPRRRSPPATEPHRAPPLATADDTPGDSSSPPGLARASRSTCPAEQLTIGRSSESGLVIRDDYTSTHHARLMLWNDEWVIQDLDSTNGTFLDGVRVTLPTPVPIGKPVTIGTTSFELRR